MQIFDHNSGDFLEIDGAKIYYEIGGANENPVLLFLHGGFGNIEDFNQILPEIKKEFRLLGIDTRGHGKSTLGAAKLTYRQIQKDVEQILAHLGIDTLSIVGFSDGGIVAFRLASFTSLKIEKIIAIGAEWSAKSLELTSGLFSTITGASWRNKFPETYESYQKLNPEPNFVYLALIIVKMWLDSGGYPNESVKNISCPLLIVRGDEDHFVSRESAVELAKLVKNAKLLNVPFAGHHAFDDQKEIFSICLNEFLD